MFKRLVAVATTTVLTVAMAVTAFAAGSINADEQKILDELKAKGVPESYIAEAKAVLEDESVDVSAADAKTAIANIDEAKKLVDAKGRTSVAQIKADAELTKSIQAIVTKTAALKSVNVKVNFDAKTGKPSIAKENGKIVPADSSIKKTGVDFSTTAAVVAGLGLSVAGIAVIAKKKDLVNA